GGPERADEVRLGDVGDAGERRDVERLGVPPGHGIARPQQPAGGLPPPPAHGDDQTTTGQTSTPRSANQGAGSIRLPSSPPWCTSKCRCGPVDWPRFPRRAIVSPASTYCPGSTGIGSMWPYTVTSPFSCRM